MDTIPPRILIADDQPDVLNALRLLLKGQGYETEAVTSPAELLQSVAAREFDLLLMDLNYARDTTSGREGLDLLSHLKEIEDAPAIVVMTGWATVGQLSKPCSTEWRILSKSRGRMFGCWRFCKSRLVLAASGGAPSDARGRRTTTIKNFLFLFTNKSRKSIKAG